MTFFLHDLAGLTLGTLIIPCIAVLPCFALLEAIERAGFAAGHGWQRLGWALLLAFSVIPVLDASLIRLAGVPAAIAVRATLAIISIRGVIGWVKDLSTPPRALVALGALWWLVVAISYLDFDWAGGLYQSLVAVDLVKHAAVTEAIAHHGLPLRDMFFARSQPSGYYFYYYTLPAELHFALDGVVDARMAFASSLLWAGLAVPALIWRIGADAGLIRLNRERRFLVTASWLCFVAGAGLPCILIEYGVDGKIAPQVELWTEEVRFALTSIIWVPHHIMALIACWTGVLFLHRTDLRAAHARWGSASLLIAMAGLSFASAFGLSIWIAITAIPIFVCWATICLLRRDYRVPAALVAAGAVAAIISIPQILDILNGRSGEAFPIAFTIRSFTYWSQLAAPSNLVLALFLLSMLPIAYAINFGYFALGANIFLRLHPRESRHENPLRSLLFVSAIISLIIASFFRSTIINNDLGIRAIWFAQFSAMIWTAAVLHALPPRDARRGAFGVLLALGLLGNVWDLVGLRILRAPYVPARGLKINTAPATDLAARQAYDWAAAHIDDNAVIQHNPGLQHRIYDFGLYGRHRPAVADKEANLFGASRQDVTQRMNALRPVFNAPLPATDVQATARRLGIDFLLFTDQDPAWKRQGRLSFDAACVYRNTHVCILPTKAATP